MKIRIKVAFMAVTALLWINPPAEAGPHKESDLKLQITTDGLGKIVLSWKGKAQLLEARGKHGQYKRVSAVSPVVVAPTEEQASYRLAADGGVFSANAVGYVNLSLRPGLSLIANPLFYTNNSIGFWLRHPPAGTQGYRYTADSGYEISTFDETEDAWSNPDLQVPIGEGFFFRNPSETNYTQTFVGEVLQGTLINHLPAGFSTKGSLVPAAYTLSQHGIPGEAGD